MRLLNIPTRSKPRILKRTAIVSVVFAGHLGVLWLLCLNGQTLPRPNDGFAGQAVAATLVEGIPESAATSQPKHQAEPQKKTAKAVVQPTAHEPSPLAMSDPSDELAEATSVEASDAPQLSDSEGEAVQQFDVGGMQGDPSQPCNLTGALASGFARSPQVKAGLDELPVAERSVANAVMLWDGQWPQETQTGGKALLRALLIKSLSAARPDCLNQVNSGPVLFFVPDGDTTAVVAIGSGQWRWGDLMPAPLMASNNFFAQLASETHTLP